ncbi:hypothetical protein [Methanobrevibacter filiformis]|uniref:Uncharacterized protein n=1 Tax=Methanobrevibacter filiformis TaxID=55758 RepID=A0A166A2R5_9EURY|nr:hypothetical protein [Methanobrevibacter filiformis]KZX11488.1 hypothetical protein MBFIL_14460 [Methanobrevibacter filiformis]
MKNETILRIEAMDILVKKLGIVDAERFIDIIKKDNFNYTEWRKNLWKDKTLNEIYDDAVEDYNKKFNK